MVTKQDMLDTLKKAALSKYNNLYYFLCAFAVIVALVVYSYYNIQMTKDRKQISKMTRNLATIPISMHGINGADAQFQYKLRDYYIASSYNSCCPGQFLDDYVSLEALANVIKRGARVLDFEIYSFHGRAVVAASPTPSFDFKGTYNSIPIGEVFSTIKSYALSGAAPNYNDPLFIHLRIKSNNLEYKNNIEFS